MVLFFAGIQAKTISLSFDMGMMSGMILIDLKKAFDTIGYDVLLQKLYAIGFSKRTYIWFKSPADYFWVI